MSTGDHETDRGQMVLLAAVAIAIVLVPLLFAYLQLGYHPDVTEPDSDHARSVERTLERSLVESAHGIPGNHSWAERDAAVTTLRDRLSPTFQSVNMSALERGTAIQVTFNQSRADRWANDTCPTGTSRSFGPCEADRGVVVQERADQTHVLAVAVDVRLTGQNSDAVVRSVIERW